MRIRPQVVVPVARDWAAPELAALRTAMASPTLYSAALAALRSLASARPGETVADTQSRCASTLAAMDWVLFVLGVAGSDKDIARSATGALGSISYGMYLIDSRTRPLLRAVEPVLGALRLHGSDPTVAQSCVIFLHNIGSYCDNSQPALKSLFGVVKEAVQRAVVSHPADGPIQQWGPILVTRLST